MFFIKTCFFFTSQKTTLMLKISKLLFVCGRVCRMKDVPLPHVCCNVWMFFFFYIFMCAFSSRIFLVPESLLKVGAEFFYCLFVFIVKKKFNCLTSFQWLRKRKKNCLVVITDVQLRVWWKITMILFWCFDYIFVSVKLEQYLYGSERMQFYVIYSFFNHIF